MNRARRFGPSELLVLAFGASLVARGAPAQQPSPGATPIEVACAGDATAGSPTERTLLETALLGSRRVTSLVLPLSDGDADSLASDLQRRVPTAAPACGTWLSGPSAHVWFNSRTARPDRDGAVWQGRGFTVSVTGGVTHRYGPFSFAIRPLLTIAENRAFQPDAAKSADDFRDPFSGQIIDLPYRFGNKSVALLDPGESYLRLGYGRTALGATTASQQWGPAHFYPLLLSAEAPGIPRLFAETRRAPVWIGDMTVEWEVGFLEASAYSRAAPGQRSRIASAALVSFSPRGLRGVDFGGARFFHLRREHGALSWTTAALPFSALTKNQSGSESLGANQAASAFVRVAPPGSGVEVYGELYREDHNVDRRDLIGEPDHEATYVLGVRRSWVAAGSVNTITIERANSRISHLARVRHQNIPYIHGQIREGHTYRGQLLGSYAMLGGGGTTVSWNRSEGKRSRAATIEFGPLRENSREGAFDSRLSSMLGVRYLEERVLRRIRYGFELALQTGYRVAAVPNVTVGFSLGRGSY